MRLVPGISQYISAAQYGAERAIAIFSFLTSKSGEPSSKLAGTSDGGAVVITIIPRYCNATSATGTA